MSAVKTAAAKLARAAAGPVAVVTLLNALGAVVAFVKDVLQAMYLGTTLQADAFTLAYFAPDMLGNLLIGTAVGTACIPVFAKLNVSMPEDRLLGHVRRTAVQTLWVSAAMFAVCALASPVFVRWLAGGDGRLASETMPMLLVMLPMVLVTPLAMVGSALHQARSRFAIPVTGPILVPLGCLLALLYAMSAGLGLRAGAAAAAWGVMLGITAMTLLIWAPNWRVFAGKRGVDDGEERVGVWKGTGLFVLILAAAQSVYVAERVLASGLETGAVAAVNYAFRLAQVPVWVYAAAFGAVILPQLSRQLALKRTDELAETMRQALTRILHVAVPTSVLLWLFREPVTMLLFRRGSFDLQSVRMTADVLEGYALTILFQSVHALALRYFLASESLRPIAVASVVTAAATIGADIALAGLYGVKGIGYGAAVGSLLGGSLSMLLLIRRVRLRGLAASCAGAAAVHLPPALLLYGMLLWNVTPQFDRLGTFGIFVWLAGCTAGYAALALVLARQVNRLKFALRRG